MVETRDYIYGGVILALIIIAGVGYSVIETGEELVCRTNKPTGWEISVQHENYAEAYCPYADGSRKQALCSEFRGTASYLRYGCKEVILIENEDNGNTNPSTTETEKPRSCVKEKCDPPDISDRGCYCLD